MVQDTYLENMRPGVPGQQANMEPVDFLSRSNEAATVIGFGVIVKQGVNDKGCVADLTNLNADNYLGLSVRERSVRPETPNGFAQYESVRIARRGCFFVTVGAAVTAGTDVTVNTTTGALSSTAVGAGQVLIPNARWETSASSGGLAIVRLSN